MRCLREDDKRREIPDLRGNTVIVQSVSCCSSDPCFTRSYQWLLDYFTWWHSPVLLMPLAQTCSWHCCHLTSHSEAGPCLHLLLLSFTYRSSYLRSNKPTTSDAGAATPPAGGTAAITTASTLQQQRLQQQDTYHFLCLQCYATSSRDVHLGLHISSKTRPDRKSVV